MKELRRKVNVGKVGGEQEGESRACRR